MAKASYNWIAILVLECLAIIIWFFATGVLIADYAFDSLNNGTEASYWLLSLRGAMSLVIVQL